MALLKSEDKGIGMMEDLTVGAVVVVAVAKENVAAVVVAPTVTVSGKAAVMTFVLGRHQRHMTELMTRGMRAIVCGIKSCPLPFLLLDRACRQSTKVRTFFLRSSKECEKG
jgi:lipid-binding SYLF domain-containing protein